MFPMPATRRWSSRASPTARDWGPARKRATMPSRSGGSAITSGPSLATAGERPRVSSSTGPFHSTAWRVRPRRTSHGVPRGSVPASSTRQRPRIRRWLRSVSPPSKPRRRFLPTASTRSSLSPSSRSARRRTAARGCGVSTATTSPSSARRRSAARWSASPSGTPRPVGEDALGTKLEHGGGPVRRVPVPLRPFAVTALAKRRRTRPPRGSRPVPRRSGRGARRARRRRRRAIPRASHAGSPGAAPRRCRSRALPRRARTRPASRGHGRPGGRSRSTP